MARINSREEFRDYLLSELGAPQLNVELTEAQLDDAIDEATDYMTRYMYGEVNIFKYLPIPIVNGQTEYDFKYMFKNEAYDSPKNEQYRRVINVIDIAGQSSGSNINYTVNIMGSPLNEAMYSLMYTGQMGLGTASRDPGLTLTNYEITMNYIDQMQEYISGKAYANFDPSTQIVSIVPTPQVNGWTVLNVYERTELVNIWNHIHTKRYAYWKSEFIWGNILSKYGNMTLPDGTTVDGREKKNEAREAMKELKETIQNESETSIFAIG